MYEPLKTHYDFKGWSLDNRNPYDAEGNLLSSVITSEDEWSGQTLQKDKYDYTYYAIFEIHPYVLTFYDDIGSEPAFATVEIPYGQTAKAPADMPYKDDSALGLYETYDFKGWSSTINGELVDLSTITVSSNEEFYAIFSKVDDIRTVVHSDWFVKANDLTFKDNYSSYTASGIIIKPVQNLVGKVTIPRTFNNETVIGITGFGSDHKVTHIFMETSEDGSKAPLCTIRSGAFEGTTSLKYFDFEGASIREIASNAFRQCSIDVEQLRLDGVTSIGNSAFNQGYSSANVTTLFIPSSVKYMGLSAFTNGSMVAGSTLHIGEETNYSDLDFSLGISTAYTYSIFGQYSSNLIGDVYFWSNVYDTKDDVVFADGEDVVTLEMVIAGNRRITGSYNIK